MRDSWAKEGGRSLYLVDLGCPGVKVDERLLGNACRRRQNRPKLFPLFLAGWRAGSFVQF